MSPRFLVALALALLPGCASDRLLLPSEGAPAAVTILDGDAQQGIVGQPLNDSLMVRVSDGHDRPVVNQAVSFVVTLGGVVTPTAVITDHEGKARFAWSLGTVSGTQVLEVGISASGQLAPRTMFNAHADPGPVDQIELVRGDGQTAQVSHAVPDSLVVRLLDSYGNPVSGEEVTWQAAAGSLSSGTVTTGPDGQAAVSWTLGSTAGVQTATATHGGTTGSPVNFSATATQGPPPQLVLVTQPSSSARSGEVFATQPVIQLEDDTGNPLAHAGVQVTAQIASGGGALEGATTVATDGNGVAQFTDLKITGAAGDRTLIFAATGHTATSSGVITITSPLPSALRSTVSAAPASIVAGTGMATITVTARDDTGAPVSGQTVTISVTGSGNTVGQPAGPTDASGVATATLTSTRPESKTITARIGSVTVNQAATVIVVPGGQPSPAFTTANVPNGKSFKVTTITITSADAFGNRLTQGGYAGQFSVMVSGKNHATPNVSDNGNGTYTATYLPLFKGNDQVDITLNGVPISGSPYQSKVK
ncbi:MAG: Ig-like domain-containing protein [Gemmatimonadota bacterium]